MIHRIQSWLLDLEQGQMASPNGLTRAAVLVPLFLDEERHIQVWLTRRKDNLTHHGGQISFPGGKIENDDADLTLAALREAEEEISIRRDHVNILGTMPIYNTRTGFTITPVVGWVIAPYIPVANPDEVEKVFSVPLKLFEEPFENEQVKVGKIKFIVPSWRWNDEIIWGVTAKILLDLSNVAKDDRV